jgi:hypothetical protein
MPDRERRPDPGGSCLLTDLEMRIQRQQIGLEGDLVDDADLVDLDRGLLDGIHGHDSLADDFA